MSTSSGAQSHSKSDAKSTPSEGDRNEHESSEDGFPEKALNINPRSQALAVDQRWQASQGITFSTMAQNKQARQPSLGINFSPRNPNPRQPYSTSSGVTSAATGLTKATQTSSSVTTHPSRILGRYAPSPRPYQPSKSPKALGSDFFSSGAAAEEDLVMDDDEDVGALLERASTEKMQPTSKIAESTSELRDATVDSFQINHGKVAPESLTATPIKPFTRIAPSETKALKPSKAASTSTQPLPTDVPKRNTHPVQTSNLPVDALNAVETRKPQAVCPRNRPESPSSASSPQRPSESEIERLAQLPDPYMTARNETKELVSGNYTSHSAKPSNLELMYVHGERIKQGYNSILNQMRDLHAFYQLHPTYHPTLLDPIEIQDLLDDFNESRLDIEQEIHQLRFVMWRVQDLKQTLSKRGTLEGSEIARHLRLFYVLNPFHEYKISQMKLRRAFRAYDRYCQRRGRRFLAKSLNGIHGQHRDSKGNKLILRSLVYSCTVSWQEVDDYEELIRRALKSDVWLHHARDLGSSWKRIIQAFRGAQKVMRESPRGLVRLRRLSRAFSPLYDNYKVIDSALKDIEKTRPAKSRLGSSTATTLPDLHDKPDSPSDYLSTASASESVAAKDEEDIRTRPRMATFRALDNPERQIHKSSEKTAGNAVELERAHDGPMQGISNRRPASNGKASKAVLRQSTNNAVRRRPVEHSGNFTSLSGNGQHNKNFCEYDLSGYVHRDRVKYSGNRVLLAIDKLLEFVKEQGDHGRQTLTDLLDLQDMKEEWHISENRLTTAMHSHRAVARIGRDFADMLLRKHSSHKTNTNSVFQYVRLKKLQFFKAAWGQSKKDLLIACNHLKNFQRRRGLVQWDQRQKDTTRTFKPKRSLQVLGSALPELSELVDMQYAKTYLNKSDRLAIEFQNSLARLLSCLQKWTDTLTVSERRTYESKNILTASHVRSLRDALRLLPPTQSKANLDEKTYPTTFGPSEASADVDPIPVILPDLNHKPLGMVKTWKVGIRKSSGKSDPKSKRPSKGHKRSDDFRESTRTRQTVEKGSPENDFGQTNLPPHCGSSLGRSETSKAFSYVKVFQIRRVKSELILSQNTMSALGSRQRKSLSHALVPITKRGSLQSSPIQKRTLHSSPLYAPSTEVESEVPSTLLGSSKNISCSPLGYRITDIVLEGALPPDEKVKPLHWEYTLYRSPLGAKVKVHYCKTKADTERIARLFFDEEVLGFDIEWKPNATAKEGIKKNVALIQIASEKRIALFHIARFRGEDTVDELVTPSIKYIMQTNRITKVGVSIKADCTRLRRFMGIESQGLFELSHLYKLVKYSSGNASSVDKRLVRLAVQVEEHLGLPLWKGQDVRGSDWSAAELNYQQVQYAASDSYAGFQLYHTLEHKRLGLDPAPPRPYHAELNLPIRLSSGLSIPTDDEQTDIEEDPPTVDDPANPPSVEELARDFLNLKIKDPHPPKSKPPKNPPKPPPKPPTPEYTLAQSWATTYRAALPPPHKSTASPASLRAYALWHEQQHTVPEAAALLRDPPLLNSTVAVYVLEALRLEKLPFERGRLEALLVHVPAVGRGRYRGFVSGCGLDIE